MKHSPDSLLLLLRLQEQYALIEFSAHRLGKRSMNSLFLELFTASLISSSATKIILHFRTGCAVESGEGLPWRDITLY